MVFWSSAAQHWLLSDALKLALTATVALTAIEALDTTGDLGEC